MLSAVLFQLTQVSNVTKIEVSCTIFCPIFFDPSDLPDPPDLPDPSGKQNF